MTVSVFISQPMRGKTSEEISAQRAHLIDVAKQHYGNICVVESYIEDAPTNISRGGDNVALWYLGESIKRLSEADVAIFASDWTSARGCKIEHECAIEYGLEVVDSYSE